MILRSRAMLDAAKGQSCVNCGKRDGTIVAAHLTGIRAAEFGKGTSIKPHDLLVCDLCLRCHLSFDGNRESYIKNPNMRKIDQSERMLACIARTLIRRVKQGVLKIPLDNDG